jgi:hypothetical protein
VFQVCDDDPAPAGRSGAASDTVTAKIGARKAALRRALLINLSECEMKAESPAPKVNVHNPSITIGLPLFYLMVPRQFRSDSSASIVHRPLASYAIL